MQVYYKKNFFNLAASGLSCEKEGTQNLLWYKALCAFSWAPSSKAHEQQFSVAHGLAALGMGINAVVLARCKTLTHNT